MTEHLVIRINDVTPDVAEWTLVNDLGAQLSRPQQGSLAEASTIAFGKKVIVLVPATEVLRTSVDLPVRSATKLLQALPFAMEEQLAEDVEVQHFAVGKRDADGRVPVAVVRNTQMSDWMQRLADANLVPAGLFSDGEALGDIPGTAIILIENEYATLREPDGNITTIDCDNLQTILELWLASRQEDTEDPDVARPLHFLIYADHDCHERHAGLIAWLTGQVAMVDEKLLPDGPLPRMASQAATNPGINLLQGAYASQSNFAVFWPAWQIAATLLICFLGIFIGVKGAELIRLNSQMNALDSSIEQAFRFTFPEVREVVDARSLLDSKLRSLTGDRPAAGSAGFLDALKIIADSLSKTENADLEALNYRSGVMDLRIRTANVEILDQIQKGVNETAELTAEIQSANADGDAVLGRLQVKSSGN